MNWMVISLSLTLAAEAAGVEFDNDVMPVLTKAGCNAASCHGAADGRGGLKLSLFGGDPAADYDAIVRQFEGRRIDYNDPASSLVVAKPAGLLDHEGGQRFDPESLEATVLTGWIAAGARNRSERHITHITVTPESTVLDQLPADIPVTVWAHFDDGTHRDVTRLAVYSSHDPDAIQADADGTMHVARGGSHAVIVQYLSRVAIARAIAPVARDAVQTTSGTGLSPIDRQITSVLQELGLNPLPAADDATLHRRVWLDLTGRLPGQDQVLQYVSDTSADKYPRLVERLLASDEFVTYWTYKYAKLLRIGSRGGDLQATTAYYDWLRRSLATDVGLTEMARQLLLAEGDTHRIGAANFYRATGDARAQAEFAGQVLMGVRLRCANCHNHPLDTWTQDDYHGLAAIFARIDTGRVIQLSGRGELIHPRTGQPAVSRIPGLRDLEPQEDGRVALAQWLTAQDNPYFAQAQVNRVWKSLMGRGLFEPTDDLRASNPPSHPQLLAELVADFRRRQGGLRPLVRQIVLSDAYQRQSVTSGDPAAQRYYAQATARALEPEVLADAIADVTGVNDRYGELPLGTRSITLLDRQQPTPSLDVLGRCEADRSCEPGEEGPGGGLAVMLHWMNGPLINRKLADPQGRLQRLLADGQSDQQIIETFYRLALSRNPTAGERAFWNEVLSGDDEASLRRERLEDFVWSLLSCREFTSNH